MSSQEALKEAPKQQLKSHFTVHQFVDGWQTPLSRHDALREGEKAIFSVSYNEESWITSHQTPNGAIAENVVSSLRQTRGKAYYYSVEPPVISWGSNIHPALKEWGEAATTDEEYSLDELEEFHCGVSSVIPVLSSPVIYSGASSTVKKRLQDLPECGGPEFPSPKRQCPDQSALYHLIPKPHMHPSPFIPNATFLMSVPEHEKAQPSYIAPYNAEQCAATPLTSRFTWVIPVCGRPPWEGSTPASLYLHGQSLARDDAQAKQEIHWTADSLLNFWDYLLTMQKGGAFGSFGVSFHFARKRHAQKGASKTKWPKHSTPVSAQLLFGKDAPPSLATVDHIKVYHDGFSRLHLRTLLHRFPYKVADGGHTSTVMILEGARLTLLDNCGQAVMLL